MSNNINDQLDRINKSLYENTEYVFSAITELIVSIKLRNKYLIALNDFYNENKARLTGIDINDLCNLVEEAKTEETINMLLEMRKILEEKKDNTHKLIKEMKNSINGWE